jgi:hypothetical protein
MTDDFLGDFMNPDLDEVQPRKPMAGWVFYECDFCGCKWKETTRDMHSPSETLCPECNQLNKDAYRWLTDSSIVDEYNNVIDHRVVTL